LPRLSHPPAARRARGDPRALLAWAQPQGIKVAFELRRECDVDVIYVFLKSTLTDSSAG
jgi:hypothetical protein